MISWYQAFILAIIALRLVAAPRDRNALSIVLVASFVSTLLVNLWTREIHAPWKLVVPGSVEVLTIAALIHLSPNRTGFLQSLCLLFAWLAHVACYFDIALGTNFVYDGYETILLLVAAAQILVCYDTLARCGRAFAAGVAAILPGRDRRVHASGGCAGLLPRGPAQIVSTHAGIKESR